MKISPVRRFASAVLSVSLLVPQGLLAQTVSTDQLMETIKKLEARIAELESKAGAPAASGTPAAPVVGARRVVCAASVDDALARTLAQAANRACRWRWL